MGCRAQAGALAFGIHGLAAWRGDLDEVAGLVCGTGRGAPSTAPSAKSVAACCLRLHAGLHLSHARSAEEAAAIARPPGADQMPTRGLGATGVTRPEDLL